MDMLGNRTDREEKIPYPVETFMDLHGVCAENPFLHIEKGVNGLLWNGTQMLTSKDVQTKIKMHFKVRAQKK